jgi:hypothetical protein
MVKTCQCQHNIDKNLTFNHYPEREAAEYRKCEKCNGIIKTLKSRISEKYYKLNFIFADSSHIITGGYYYPTSYSTGLVGLKFSF